MPTVRRIQTAGGVYRWRWRVSVKGEPIRRGTCRSKSCALRCALEEEHRLKRAARALPAAPMFLAMIVPLGPRGQVVPAPGQKPERHRHRR